MSSQPFHVVMCDDDPADVELFKLAMKKAHVALSFASVGDGEEMLRYLKREAPHEHAPRPDLIFLDINIPKMNGIELLKIIKSDDNFKSIPVLMLTCSDRTEDITSCYRNHANSYIVKPLNLSEFVNIVSVISSYWIGTATYPKGDIQGGEVDSRALHVEEL